MKTQISEITARITERSKDTRSAYLANLDARQQRGQRRSRMSCGNLAHTMAACSPSEKQQLAGDSTANIGIVTAYNDMLSAHQPYREVPELLKQELEKIGATAQVAGGVPAMCDGVTQGQSGMELSLFSRDVIAMATAVSLSHDAFDGVMLLGVCDKIVPGLLIGALRFGHLPTLLVPAGPMPSGLPNPEKARVRQNYADGKANRNELLAAESASYHSPGTCTFYGTANSNQLLMELMGLHLPGASFVNPETELRTQLHCAAAKRIGELAAQTSTTPGIGHMVNEKSIVNALVGLLATGGSTNHTLHLPAIAAAAGIQVSWEDISDLSAAVPLLTRIYPNGVADINHFQQAGGMAVLIGELLDGGMLHADVNTIIGADLNEYRQCPVLIDNKVQWQPGPEKSADLSVLASTAEPFDDNGGLRLLRGNLGDAVIKVSAVKTQHRVVEAPAVVFDSQDALKSAFESGQLERDLVAVIRFQGPCSNGMPELHKLTPYLGLLQDRGFNVALVTDGRMSGASGKIPAAIHLTPEASRGGMIAGIQDGDPIRLDANSGELSVLVSEEEFAKREPASQPPQVADCGQDLFSLFRNNAAPANQGAGVFCFDEVRNNVN